jgi:hypothetical protein
MQGTLAGLVRTSERRRTTITQEKFTGHMPRSPQPQRAAQRGADIGMGSWNG